MNHCGDDTDRRKSCTHADEAADKAVKKTFAILGVDVDQPREVREFQESLRFGDKLRRNADKGALAFLVTMISLFAAAIWAGMTVKFGGE